MTKQRSTKRALLSSAIALMVCVAMLIGTTFAWFTDSVTSSGNKIQAGTLKIDLELYNTETKEYESIKESEKAIFDYENWEPGYTEVNLLKVENEGSLALKWVAKFVSDFELTELANVIDVYVLPSATELAMPADRSLAGYEKVGTVADFVNTIETTTVGTLEKKGDAAYLGIALKMQEEAGNKYQGMSLGGTFDIQIVATQYTYEKDSFDNQYDVEAKYPVEVKNVGELEEALKNGDNVVLADDIAITETLMATKDAVIDLNGNSITAPSSGNMFQSQSNAAPSMIITSSAAGAEINVSGGDTSVLLGYGSTEIKNVTINVEGCDNASPNPFKVYGDLILGEGTVVNVDYLGTAFINNNGAHAIVIDGAKINVGTFKTNGTAIITLNQASTLEMKNTEIKIDNFVLSSFGGDSLVSKVDGVTIEDCTFDVTDSNGASCTFVAKDGKYRLVQE